ncbi:monovalent cation:H+ antiporter, CPA1 (nhx1) [Coemansia interrupta]|uniref:Sodium/hydrogen exchanger n=1 Tax=Coemansia interrupta TaxID=1126814 RepID=A0A9W8LKP7_9FUNG|nr:monovalent cation:H+ antiporter, CPA1 (nhx1) [Coemansia interrupta]
MQIDPTLCGEAPSSQNTILTALLCIGTFLSYLPQHIKILQRRSSDGLSPYFILLGTVGAGSNITNIILLQFIALQCCTVQTLGVCVASLLGIVQVCIQGLMFYITFVLYMVFFPEQNKYEPVGEDAEEGSSGESSPLLRARSKGVATVEWQTALWVSAAVATHATVCLVMSTLLVAVVGPYAGPTRTWASLLGLFSLCLTCLQFFPQIIKTWRAKTVGALSIPMMLMQTPGGFLFAYSIAIRPGVNWSSWISTFMAATLQGVLLAICLMFEARAKQEQAQEQANEQNGGEAQAGTSQITDEASHSPQAEISIEQEQEPRYVVWFMAAGAAAAESGSFLEDMKRSNEVESDHRNIMTPEFRQFCIVTREHIVSWATLLVLFAGSYAAVARACSRRQTLRPTSAEEERKPRHRRFLVAPYASEFRARQVALVVAASGLASALMTAALLVVTVALANAMDHGDPRAAPSWRVWLLPVTLLNPGEAHSGMLTTGPQVAHDFPPVLRRLWRYQSVVSVAAAAVIVPLGILFEGTPRRAPTLQRLRMATLRWLLAAALLLGMWNAVTRVSRLSEGATLRYSVHHSASVCVALPAVLALVPRGTWALFAWLRACVGQRHERARNAQARYRRLRLELARIELRLDQAIGSWKGGQVSSDGERWASDVCSSDSEPETLRTQSAALLPALPPMHPGLPRNTNFVLSHPNRTISGRPRRGSAQPFQTGSQGKSALPPLPLSPHLQNDGWHSREFRSSANLAASAGAGSELRYSSDEDLAAAEVRRAAAKAVQRRRREREREMERLSRQIKKYHAQLLFVRAEMTRTEKSGLLDIATGEVEKKSFYVRVLGSLSAAALIVATTLCWLLVVVQVGRGALSAIFVGEPDLTQNYTYFLPALVDAGAAASSNLSGLSSFVTTTADKAAGSSGALVPHALATACQLLSASLLFVVVMFGLLSMSASFEDSVHPLRFLASSYVGRLLRARQWECLPYLLLHPETLAAITPSYKPETMSGPVAGDTNRVFFSSSADLASFYRHLQREAAESPTAPNTLLPGGILPEGFFQARTWGRRVFLLLDPQARPVAATMLLSVLRTTGLISERAYVLPIASLVEPLWIATSPAPPAFVLDEEMVLHPAAAAIPVINEMSAANPAGFAGNNTADPVPVLPKIAPLTRKQQHLLLQPIAAASMCLVPASATHSVYYGPKSELPTQTVVDSRPKDILPTTGKAAMVSNHTAAAIERRISRRVLHQTLAADTLSRMLVRGVLFLSSKVSSHLHISLGYCIWWLDPDLIVPISPTTVDTQLGYLPQTRATVIPINGVASLPGYSEWYGMLRRMELQKTWLPQADDGTPLVLQPVNNEYQANVTILNGQRPHRQEGRLQTALSIKSWTLLVYSHVACGSRMAASYLYSTIADIARRLWNQLVSRLDVAFGVISKHLQGTPAGEYLDIASATIALAKQKCIMAGSLAWNGAAVPLLNHLTLAATGLSSSISYIVSRAIPLVVSLGGTLQQRQHQTTDKTLAVLAQSGIYSTVPSVFLSEFWDNVISQGGPALQRLRPELWPHLFADQTSSMVPEDSSSQKQQPGRPGLDYKDILQPLSVISTSGSSRQHDDVSVSAISTTSLLPHQDGTATSTAGPALAKKHNHASSLSSSEDQAGDARPVRKIWSTLDWLLALYRVVLGILACRSEDSISASATTALISELLSSTATTLLSTVTAVIPGVPNDDSGEPLPEDEEKASSQALLILVSLLIAALLTSYYLQRWRIRTVHETVLSIFAGMAVGLVLRFSTGDYIKRIVTFDHTVFFNMLLPPIILNCGFNLQKTSITRNMAPVLTFAFIGTAVSAVVIGVLVQIYSFTSIESIGFSLLDSLMLGTILSATDPVTILAVFEQLRVDPKLFSIIFGETVFNDAVAIVLFVTLGDLRSAGLDFTLGAIPGMLSSFMFVFTASLLVGMAMGVMMSLVCKHSRLYEYPSIEASLVLLVAYHSYLFSNAIELSGIVSLLFCAATMRQYTYRSLSTKSKRATRYLFHLLSGLAENFVFIYLGISLFTASDVMFRPVFIVFVMIATCISRYMAIFPLSRVINAIFKYRHPSAPSSAQPVTHEEQTMLFWAGLRGAVAVALASEVSGKNGPLLRTTVLCVVVLSVTIFGGTTPQVVQLLGIRTGVPQPDSSDEDEDFDSNDADGYGYGYGDSGDDTDYSNADGNHRRSRRVIDLSVGQGRSASPKPSFNNPSPPMAPRPLDSQILDVEPERSEPESTNPIALERLPRSLSRFSSSWAETGESWFARIKNSYRSFDRSLIYDVDRYYIQPLLIREQNPSLLVGSRRRSRHSRRGQRQYHRENTDGGGLGRASRTVRAYSSSDLPAVGSTSGYRQTDGEFGNWGSSGVASTSGASDTGGSPTPRNQQQNQQQHQQRLQRPLLKKST